MNTDRINRGILLAVVVIGAIAYGLLYDHASASFKVLVPVGLAFVVGLIIREAVNARKR